MMLESRYCAWCATLLLVVASAVAVGQTAKERELRLIAVLQSDAPPQDKAITCKQLAIYGTEAAVPALAALLPDEKLSSWARIALEAIPGPAADEALRQATGKVRGMLLVGVINSIGVRRDAQAIAVLAERLKDTDVEVASAAAVALGHIGGEQAAQKLMPALVDAPADVRAAAAEGCLLCAEWFLSHDKTVFGIRFYDAVRRANVPKQKVLEATRGAILARGLEGIPILLEQLKSADKGQFSIGLWTARELAGREVTEALAAELNRLSADRQPLLLLAIADRNDAAVLPAVVKAATNGSGRLRTTAASVLERLGSVTSVPVLLDAAIDDDAELAQAAKTTLARLPGKDVDADLLSRLSQAKGKTRQVLIELVAQRQIDEALPAVVLGIEDAEAGIRSAAVKAVGVIGRDKQVGDLVKLLGKTQDPTERADIEKALLAVSGRGGADCAQYLLPLMRSADSELRMIGLHGLAVAGGPDALTAVKSAINDREETVQDEAVRTLSTWPNNWPGDARVAEPLLMLAKSGNKISQQVLGLRGYLQYVRRDTKLSDDEKVAKVNDLMPLIKRSEEKRLAIAVVGEAPTAGSLELLRALAADSAVTEEACSAIVGLVEKSVQGLPKEQCRSALQMVIEKSKDNTTRRKAEGLLKKVQ